MNATHAIDRAAQRLDATTPLTLKLGALVATICSAIAATWWAAALKADVERRVAVVEAQQQAIAHSLEQLRAQVGDGFARITDRLDRWLATAPAAAAPKVGP